jgi:hypothetical protein
VTWAIVVYPAWDNWQETDRGTRDTVDQWLHSWQAAGPPHDARRVVEHLEVVETVIDYFIAAEPTTGTQVSYFVNGSADPPYVAIIEIG